MQPPAVGIVTIADMWPLFGDAWSCEARCEAVQGCTRLCWSVQCGPLYGLYAAAIYWFLFASILFPLKKISAVIILISRVIFNIFNFTKNFNSISRKFLIQFHEKS